jgi:hypothetical protein
VDVDVHIRNATPAHLGLDASTQERVVVLLNHEPLAIKRFDIRLVEGDDPGYADARDIALAMTGTASTERTTEYLKARALRGERDAGQGGSDTAPAVLRRASADTGARSSIGKADDRAGGRRPDQGRDPGVATAQRRAARSGPGFASTRGPDRTGTPGKSFDRRALHTIGANPRRRECDEDALTLGSGLRMTLRLARAECRPGINTLALIVSDGFRHTESQVVSFVVAPADAPPDRGGMLKGRPSWAFTRLPGDIVALMGLERDLERAVSRRGGTSAPGAGTDGGTRRSDEAAAEDAAAFWIEGRSRRRKALIKARDAARRRSGERRRQLEEAAGLIASGGLGPHPRRPEKAMSLPAIVPPRDRPAPLGGDPEDGGEEKRP